jgi:hypothetical protein
VVTTYDYHTNRAYYAAHAEDDRDRAVIARAGGHFLAACIAYRTPRPPRRVHPFDYLHESDDGWASERRPITSGPENYLGPVTLPEAAFDWPIYRFAAVHCVNSAWTDKPAAVCQDWLALRERLENTLDAISESENRVLDGNR